MSGAVFVRTLQLEFLQQRHHRAFHVRHESISYLGYKPELGALIAGDYQCLERTARRITADHELLRPLDFVFEPGSAAPAGLVNRAPALGYDSLKLELWRPGRVPPALPRRGVD